VYAARSAFSISQFYWAAEKAPPIFLDVCGEAVRVEKCPSLKSPAHRADGFSESAKAL